MEILIQQGECWSACTEEVRRRDPRACRQNVSGPLRASGESKLGARRYVGELLDIKAATLRNWIETADRAEAPSAPGEAVDADEVRRLRRKVSNYAGLMRF